MKFSVRVTGRSLDAAFHRARRRQPGRVDDPSANGRTAAHAPQADWRFVTASNEQALAPLLDDFGQPVARLRFTDGRWTGLYRHVLKVFLLDSAHRVRNVYSTGLLDAELVLNDVRTLLMQR